MRACAACVASLSLSLSLRHVQVECAFAGPPSGVLCCRALARRSSRGHVGQGPLFCLEVGYAWNGCGQKGGLTDPLRHIRWFPDQVLLVLLHFTGVSRRRRVPDCTRHMQHKLISLIVTPRHHDSPFANHALLYPSASVQSLSTILLVSSVLSRRT